MKTVCADSYKDLPEEFDPKHRTAERSVTLKFYTTESGAGLEIDFEGQPARPKSEEEFNALTKDDQIALTEMVMTLETIKASLAIKDQTQGDISGLLILQHFLDRQSPIFTHED